MTTPTGLRLLNCGTDPIVSEWRYLDIGSIVTVSASLVGIPADLGTGGGFIGMKHRIVVTRSDLTGLNVIASVAFSALLALCYAGGREGFCPYTKTMS